MAKKSKKGGDNIASRLSLVMKSGKYTFGYKTTLKMMRTGKAKLILVSNNCPRKSELEYYALLSKVIFYRFNGTNIELGAACGKLYRASCLSIMDAGDSDIIKAIESGGASS
ncbi:hypothetical protein NDN08_004588 [Rhodosorus marinus]|uniref:Ribosomal protein eL8/eL30/eS12/Gadd45 domain-containing protein n=2 Tax=Eukaryota TaxID=2759 RepID=A0AAV8UQ95_9RHOD|nr:hypothetical protein NDN08_004588 [Rhodosorus marinus]|eukprot:CAMPEP_0113954552 /NCGR_PEP_ID=MMETSP0011_2-20120614/641_1 /TAXON_ID=101924 /ORGANISM="Rhodosorus marinus" /LENGTH=111 /DNA_ID=CAMNT_0000963743 /DNA_START=83 /DNA_END=418 /DNA_ORIENTATION=- /assembly_acc=CAM_ASM_000156